MLRNRKALAIAPQWYQYRRKSHDLLAWLSDIQRSVDQLPDPPEGERVKVKGHKYMHNAHIETQAWSLIYHLFVVISYSVSFSFHCFFVCQTSFCLFPLSLFPLKK